MKFWFSLKESRRYCRFGFRYRAGSRASARKVTGSAVPEPVLSAAFAFDLPAEPRHLATWIRSLVPTTRDRDAREVVVVSLFGGGGGIGPFLSRLRGAVAGVVANLYVVVSQRRGGRVTHR